MIAVDSSVVIAAFSTWHKAHHLAHEALRNRPRLVAHVGLEAYSVITRLPMGQRAEAGMVAEFLNDSFPEPPLLLSTAAVRELVTTLCKAGVSGGAVYDGLIALTAAEHQASLLSLDKRATQTYQRCRVSYQLLVP
ncbi:MAG: PIN domain-containing protein [Candidatus Dormibacteraceae bacterium]